MRRVLIALPFVLVLAIAWLVNPLSPRALSSHPAPASDYDAALRLIDSLRATDSRAIAADCGTRLLTHGARTARAVVLFHGLTNCPAQWDSIAHLLYAQGANVLIPRLPRHGYADKMTAELARLDAGELRDLTDRAIDAAAGLGDSVTVAGLSTGGCMAAWAGQFRRDVDRAVIIAPMFGYARAPGPLFARVLTRAAGVLPNLFVWWDSEKREHVGGPRHVYPRFGTRSIAATMRLGWDVTADAPRHPPAARSLVMITVGGDPAADNTASATLVRNWQAIGSSEVTSYEFPATLHLNHDVVDPEQVGGNPAITYPVLLKYLGP